MTLKQANRGAAMPAILALGIFIGASLALASPLGSRMGSPAPRHIVEAGPAPTPEGGSGTASEESCSEAVWYLAGGDWGLARAIDAVLESCEGNPRAPGLVNALAHLGANQEAHGSQPSQAGGGSSVGPQGGGAEASPPPEMDPATTGQKTPSQATTGPTTTMATPAMGTMTPTGTHTATSAARATTARSGPGPG